MIKAKKDSTVSQWSDTNNFTTINRPTLVSPVNNAIN